MDLTHEKIKQMERLMKSYTRTPTKYPFPTYPFKILYSSYLTNTIQTKFPKKKNNKRWVKKFKKKYTITKPSEKVVFDNINGCIYCHPAIGEQLIKQFKETGVIALNNLT